MPSSWQVSSTSSSGRRHHSEYSLWIAAHRLHGVGAADRAGGRLGHSVVLDLASIDQRLDRAGELFDRHFGVDPVLVVEVDGVDAEALQRALGRARHLVGAQHPPTRLAFHRVDVLSELGGDDDAVSERCQGLSDELLVGVRAVGLGGVEEGDAAVHRSMDQRGHLVGVGTVAVPTGHAHASEPDGRDFEAAGSEDACLHDLVLPTLLEHESAGCRTVESCPSGSAPLRATTPRRHGPGSSRLGAVALLALVAACSDDGSDGSAGGTTSDGPTLYANDCASCHGGDLRGTDFGPSLLSEIYEPDQLPDDSIRVAIRNGVAPHHWEFGPMPAIARLDDGEITAIITYIRDVQERQGFEPYPPE